MNDSFLLQPGNAPATTYISLQKPDLWAQEMSHRKDVFGENFRAQWSTWQTRRRLTRARLPPPSQLSWALGGPVTHTHSFQCDRRIHLIWNIPQPAPQRQRNNGSHPSMMLGIVRKELVKVRYMLHQDLYVSMPIILIIRQAFNRTDTLG